MHLIYASAERFLVVAFVSGVLVATPASAGDVSKPLNVLLIIADDMNCQLGCYGVTVAKTPNIDRLAARGLRFDRAFCNYPVCNASRTSFLSGRYPESTGVLNNNTDPRVRLGPDFQFLPEYFRAQGYFTAGCGKIAHGGFNDALSWDYYSEPARGIDADGEESIPKKKSRNGESAKSVANDLTTFPFEWEATPNKDAEEADGQVARRLLRFLSEHEERPFFIAAGFHKPHVPHTAPRKYFDLHDAGAMPVAVEPTDFESDIPPIALKPGPKYLPDLPPEVRLDIVQHYFAATSFMDAQVGLLLDELDRLELWRSTIVIFVGDHGWHLGEHGGMYAKMSLMDESARAPLIVAAPGMPEGRSTSAIVEFVDIYPTLIEAAGLAPPKGLQGESFRAVLKAPKLPGRDTAYTIVLRGPTRTGRALRSRAFTYLEWPDGSQQLYDAVNDPHEHANLVKDARYAGTLAEMKASLAERRAEIAQVP